LLCSRIAGADISAAAPLGVAAGQRLPTGVAITLAVVATLVFQPARRRMERLADRWVFGTRADPDRLITDLGEALAGTFDLSELLPRMASTLEEGLGVRWARVRLETEGGRARAEQSAGGDTPAALIVPVVSGGETLGTVECGPKVRGTLTPEDVTVVETFARQAALAVRNVRLTTELADHARELAASRTRLVRAQEVERRRIERNIHDGVQQDLVALVSHTAHVRSLLGRDPAGAGDALEQLQVRLRGAITELRELAHGIHPTLLTDRGLLEAVEALAARSGVPVTVRADPSLRGLRFADAAEGAGYFTVAESLANVLKHASATEAQVTLTRANGTLRIEVSDDGVGFDTPSFEGDGLRNLAERVAALGGALEVSSRPGGGATVRADLRVGGPEGRTETERAGA
jgi:signal transduction histidine kinase